MNLDQVVSLPELAELSALQILAYGNELVIVGGTDEPWSYSGVAVTFGELAAEGIYQAILSADLVGAAQVYLTRGMQLSLDSVQDKLTAIGLAVPALAGVCHALKEIGITHGSRWQKWGIAQPNLEQIEAAIAPTEMKRIATFFNQFVQPYVARPDATLSGLIDVINAAFDDEGQ